MSSDEIVPGDIIAVNHGHYGRKEGLVISSHVDYAGRQVVEVQFAPSDSDVYRTLTVTPQVTRIRRTISYGGVPVRDPAHKHRTIERTIYW